MRQIAVAAMAGLTALFAVAATAQASVEISAAPTKNMSCSAGVCSPTAKKAVLNATELTSMLASSDVKVTTGNGAITITVSSPFSWTNTHRLTLDAYQTVSFRAPVTVAGVGAVTIAYNDGGPGGDLIFFPGAKLDFWDTSSGLVVNGSNYTLAKDIKTLADQIGTAPGGHYALTKDINASKDGVYTYVPIPTELSGVLEGLGHKVRNLTLNVQRSHEVGFFARISGTLRDIKFQNMIVETNGGGVNVGSVAADNVGAVVNVGVSGSVTAPGANSLIGGLVAWNQGSIVSSSTSGSVQATGGFALSGGIVGRNDGLVQRSHSAATADGWWVGGLVGMNTGSVSLSSAAGKVTVHSSKVDTPFAGGLIGYSTGDVSQSFSTGDIQGGASRSQSLSRPCVGGLVGISYAAISDSYATGAVTLDYEVDVGGFVGGQSGVFTDTYSTGLVEKAIKSKVGGYLGVGAAEGSANNYWDIDSSGTQIGCGYRHCIGISGLTDVQLKSGLPVGFDPAIWAQSPSINNGYPYLIANPPVH